MIRKLGLLIVVLSFAVLPMAQDRRRYKEPPPLESTAEVRPPDWEHSTQEERARRQAQAELARQQLRKLHEETNQLVTLANELKVELDKTAAQKLSLGAVKKTEQIEKLAKNIRQRMKNL